MEIFRRRQVEKEIEESNKFSDGGRFHAAYEGKDETEILRSEPKRFRKRAEERIKAIDLAIERARADRNPNLSPTEILEKKQEGDHFLKRNKERIEAIDLAIEKDRADRLQQGKMEEKENKPKGGDGGGAGPH